MLIIKQLLLLDPLYPPWRSPLGASCISFKIEARAQAFLGLRPHRPPDNNNAPARYFLTFYSAPVLLRAAESRLSSKTGAPARDDFPFYSGPTLSPRRRKRPPLPNNTGAPARDFLSFPLEGFQGPT